eukprot:gene5006-3601_t
MQHTTCSSTLPPFILKKWIQNILWGVRESNNLSKKIVGMLLLLLPTSSFFFTVLQNRKTKKKAQLCRFDMIIYNMLSIEKW